MAESIAGLPLHVYQQSGDGAKVKALDHPLCRLLHDEPNPEMTSFVFRETLMTHLLLWGNAFTQVTLSAFKLGTFLKISEELLNDAAFNVEQYLAVEFARRIGAAEEEAFLTGDGKNKPIGIFNASGGGQNAVTTAKATDITADELIDLHYALRGPYRKNAVWLMNDSTVKTIRKLKDGNGQYLWQPALTAGDPDMIPGRPVHTSTFVPELKAGASTVAFGDLAYYWVADRQGRSFKRLNELFATGGTWAS